MQVPTKALLIPVLVFVTNSLNIAILGLIQSTRDVA